MEKSKIDWCDSTWNPVSGCYHECEYCYARNIAKRFGGWSFTPGKLRINISGDKTYICSGEDYYGDIKETEYGMVADITDPFLNERGKCAYPFGFTPTFHRYKLDEYANKKGRNIFVCSMADLFGKWVPDEWIEEVMNACYPQHNYLFLTKNVERYTEYGVPRDKNKWYGTSITKKSDIDRFNYLPAFCNTFVSIEPLLEDLEVEKCNIMFMQVDWVIIGAETGRRKDKIVPDRKWIEDILNKCRKNGKPVFMKSSLSDIWGEPLIQEFPDELQRR